MFFSALSSSFIFRYLLCSLSRLCYFNDGCDSGASYYSNFVSSFNLPALQSLRRNDVCPQPGPSRNDSISVFYQNVRSLKPFSTYDDGSSECKLSVLKDIVYGSDFDLVALTETWLSSSVADIEILPY